MESTFATDAAQPPTRPSPYIAPGDGWTHSVRVGRGTWRHNPLQVSQGWAVYNQTGKDFHVSINSSYIADAANPTPGAPMDTHVTSNHPIGGKELRWPKPGALSVTQLAWMNERNGAGQFDALIQDFEARMRACARNVTLSRDYDRDLAFYRKARAQEANVRRAGKVSYTEDLAEWVAACPADVVLKAFRVPDSNKWHVLDLDRGAVLELSDSRQPVWQSSVLHLGFVNMCQKITGEVAALAEEQLTALTAGLVFLSINDQNYAMTAEVFDACQEATGVISLAQLVEQAGEGWARKLASGKPYTEAAADKTVINLVSPSSAQWHVKTGDLFGMEQLVRIGTAEAGARASAIEHLSGLPGVYGISSVQALQDQVGSVGPAVRIKGAATVFALTTSLVKGWSRELSKASSVNAAELVKVLVQKAGHRVFAENLQVAEEACMIVYLLHRSGKEPARYIGPKDEVLPDAKPGPDNTLVLSGQVEALRACFGGGLSNTAAARSESTIVLCGNNGSALNPPLFVDASDLTVFDLAEARKGFAVKAQEQSELRRAEVNKAKAVIADANEGYASAWRIVYPQLTGGGFGRLQLCVLDNKVVPVLLGSRAERTLKEQGALPAAAISVALEDRKKSSAGWYVHISLTCEKPAAEQWAKLWANYLMMNKPDLPGQFAGYIVSVRA